MQCLLRECVYIWNMSYSFKTNNIFILSSACIVRFAVLPHTCFNANCCKMELNSHTLKTRTRPGTVENLFIIIGNFGIIILKTIHSLLFANIRLNKIYLNLCNPWAMPPSGFNMPLISNLCWNDDNDSILLQFTTALFVNDPLKSRFIEPKACN